MRTKHLLVGNWKMNLGPAQTAAFCADLREKIVEPSRTDVWVAPPTVSLQTATQELADSFIAVGAQNVHWSASGAFTGETSPLFLTELGVKFSLVGHSERRTYFGETSERVAQRMNAALNEGLSAIVCIGETEQERVSGATEKVLADQLAPVFEHLNAENAGKVVLAYEPVWAIGTGRVASIAEISATHQYIQTLWQGQRLPSDAVILYGGSVTPQNFAQILALKEVAGALVGGASIKLDQWIELVAIAEATTK